LPVQRVRYGRHININGWMSLCFTWIPLKKRRRRWLFAAIIIFATGLSIYTTPSAIKILPAFCRENGHGWTGFLPGASWILSVTSIPNRIIIAGGASG